MNLWAVIVEFETHEGREEEFTAIIRDHAQRTLHEEPGCLRFDVIKPVERDGKPIANRLIVDELYATEAALRAHEESPRMPVLQANTASLLKSRRLIIGIAIGNPGAEESIAPEELNASNDD